MKSLGYSFTHIGSRSKNQDSLLILDDKQLYAVADGVGGGYNGEVASKMAVDGLSSGFSPDRPMADLFQELQRRIYGEAVIQFGEPLMGTTLTAVAIRENEANIAHCGDSHLYLLRDDELKLLTQDHEMYDDSIPGNVLCSYLGISQEQHPLTIQEIVEPVQPGDKIILCSDGLYKQITETRIVEFVKAYPGDPKKACEEMTLEAIKADYSDNVTVVLVELA